MIEKDPHLRYGQGASGSVLQHRACLLQGDAGKQLDNLTNWNTVLKVLEEGSDRHSRAAEHPGSADALGVAFNCLAA